MGRHVDDRIPTVSDYQGRIGVGSGTVQKALAALEDLAAVSLTRHGHQGTRILDLNRGTLWGLSGRGQLRVVSTLPGAIDAFGLIKGLYAQFTRAGIPVGLRYQRGADVRARTVLNDRADIAIMSRGAARTLPPSTRRRTTMIELRQGSYYAPGSLVRLAKAAWDPRGAPPRIAVDLASHDHRVLTDAEFPLNQAGVRVDCPYTELPAALITDRVDVGVWHRALLTAPLGALGLHESPLTTPAAERVQLEVSPAVILVRADDEALRRLVEAVDTRALLRAQRSLLAMNPESPSILEAVWSRS